MWTPSARSEPVSQSQIGHKNLVMLSISMGRASSVVVGSGEAWADSKWRCMARSPPTTNREQTGQSLPSTAVSVAAALTAWCGMSGRLAVWKACRCKLISCSDERQWMGGSGLESEWPLGPTFNLTCRWQWSHGAVRDPQELS